MRNQNSADRAIARIASRQHGNVTHAQLVVAGISRSGIRRRVERGLLFPEHRGVYRVGHRAPNLEARYMGAVLACGDDALLCRLAAAHLTGLVKGEAPEPEVVAVWERRVPGVITHRTS